jgi:ankyrin repeat protein
MSNKNKRMVYYGRWLRNLLLIPVIFSTTAILVFAATMGEDLIQAARNNDVNSLNALIAKGADVNTRNVFLATPLIVAAKSGNTECVKALLQAGADANAKCISTCTPLIWSADLGHTAVVKVLIDNGADLEISDFYGWTPLMKATYRSNIEIVKLLVEKGADVNAKNSAGNSILYIAEELNKQPAILNLLVTAGATR